MLLRPGPISGFVAALAVTLASAQDTFPTIRSSSELVVVPVVVKNRDGHVATGLNLSEFTVTVDGKSQSVTHFEEVHTEGSAVLRKATGKQDEFSNTGLTTSGPTGLTIVLLDLVNTPFEYQALARNQLIGYLTKRQVTDQLLAIVALTPSGLREIHTLSNDNDDLIASLRGTRSELNRATIERADPGKHELSGRHGDIVEQEFSNMMIGSQRQLTVEAMVQVAGAFRSIPGRKNLVWTTAGFPFYLSDPRAFGGISYGPRIDYDSVWRQLNDANISVYPIDVRGVFDPIWDAEFSPEHGTYHMPGAESAKMGFWNTRQTMTSFAEATGGRACLGQNEMGICYADFVEDASDYYLLYFYLAPEMRKKGWHKLNVKVNGSYEVRARQGFTVTKADRNPTSDLDLVEALRSPLESGGIPISLKLGEQHRLADSRQVLRVPTLQKKNIRGRSAKYPVATVPFRLVVSKDSISVDAQQRNWVAVRVAAAAVTEDNEVLAIFSKIIEGNVPSEGVRQLADTGFTFEDSVLLPPGKLRVRFGVFDVVGHKIGTVEAPIEIAKSK
jgi:VWFA-related protein